MRRRFAVVLLIVVIVFVVASAIASAAEGGARAMPTAAAPTAAAPAVRVTDDWGRAVTLAALPRRIVSMAPHATELLFAAGVGPSVVAVDRSSDRPAEALALPRFSAHPRPDPERLLSLRPDLVVLWGAAAGREFVDRLEALGVRVFVSEPVRLDDVATTLERFAMLGSAPERGRDEARRFRRVVAELRARYADKAPVQVFVQVWGRPLITLSDRDSFADVLKTCGARNVFGAERIPAPQVDAEAVLRRAPRLVLAFSGGRGEAARETWSRLALLAPSGPAEFLLLDPSIQRPTPRMLAPMAQLCAAVDAARMQSASGHAMPGRVSKASGG